MLPHNRLDPVTADHRRRKDFRAIGEVEPDAVIFRPQRLEMFVELGDPWGDESDRFVKEAGAVHGGAAVVVLGESFDACYWVAGSGVAKLVHQI